MLLKINNSKIKPENYLKLSQNKLGCPINQKRVILVNNFKTQDYIRRQSIMKKLLGLILKNNFKKIQILENQLSVKNYTKLQQIKNFSKIVKKF